MIILRGDYSFVPVRLKESCESRLPHLRALNLNRYDERRAETLRKM
jgi:hypothetical protein